MRTASGFSGRVQKKSFRRIWLLTLLVTSVLPLFIAFALVMRLTQQDSIAQQREWFLDNSNNIYIIVQKQLEDIVITKRTISSLLTRYLSDAPPELTQSYGSLQNYESFKSNILSIEQIHNVARIRVFTDRIPFLPGGDRITFFPLSDLDNFGEAADELRRPIHLDALAYLFLDNEYAWINARSIYLYNSARMISFYSNIYSMNGELIAVYLTEYTVDDFLSGMGSALDQTTILLSDGDGAQVARLGEGGDHTEDAALQDGLTQTRHSFIDVRSLSPSGWRLFVETEKSTVPLRNTLTLLYSGIIALTFLVSVLIANVASRRTINRINGYLAAVNSVGNASEEDNQQLLTQLTLLTESSRTQDELDGIMTSFCALIRDNIQLITQVSRHRLEVERYKYKVLREEINPHFLYNALDTMRLCLMIGEREQATRALDALSRFYRIALSKGRDVITLAEELDMVRSYLELENIGYDGQLHWVFDVDPDLDACQIPKFIVQPLIENSIVHGKVPSADTPLNIRIEAYRDEDGLTIGVENDGRGIDGQMLARMNEQLLSGTSGGDALGFGLFNVNQRIRLMYGEQYGVRIESDFAGVRTRIRLPGRIGQS